MPKLTNEHYQACNCLRRLLQKYWNNDEAFVEGTSCDHILQIASQITGIPRNEIGSMTKSLETLVEERCFARKYRELND